MVMCVPSLKTINAPNTEIDKLEEKEITLDVLKKHNLVTKNIKRVKVMLSGEINRAVLAQLAK
jgi:large subunit ribosomal protein L15